jgi:hypothetical protein
VIIDAEGQGEDARVQVNFGRQGVKWLAVAVAKLERVRKGSQEGMQLGDHGRDPADRQGDRMAYWLSEPIEALIEHPQNEKSERADTARALRTRRT